MPKTSSKTIPCPNCGVEIEVKEHPQFRNVFIAHHNCTGLGMVQVYREILPEDSKPPAESETEQ